MAIVLESNEHGTQEEVAFMAEERRDPKSGATTEDHERGYAYNDIDLAYRSNNILDEAAWAVR